MPENQKRQVAYFIRIADIIRGRYVKEEGWQPNYILTESGRKVSRVNMAGVVIAPPTDDSGFMGTRIDDGSGTISIRVFDNPGMLRGLEIGEPVFVIGRPRQYGSETYLLAEIVKKINDKRWIELRKLEMEIGAKNAPPAENKPAENEEPEKIQPGPAQEKMVVEEESIAGPGEATDEKREPTLPEKVYSLIKGMDTGSGANFEEIVAKAGENSEKVVKSLLMEGEIFEVSPGKLKVLE